ncbi:MAG: ABC transporter substrate-binding protein, partial [Pseudomonadales bacterium]|nr:ABC transporter substrate-binding protein [Pseudomonadales bacterium]
MSISFLQRIAFSLAIIVSVTMVSSLKAETTISSRTLTSITVQLKWKHQFQFAGFYAAIEQGFYQEAGFKVTLKEADYMTNPIEEVLSGRADYGVANSELMLYRMNGDPVTVLAAIIQHSPIVLMSLKSSNILSPQDLIGKKIMYPEGHYGANTLGILLKEGIEQDQIESIPLSFNINDLIEGKVDAMVGYLTDQPYLLKAKDIKYNLIHPRSYGIDFYGDTLFTREVKADKAPKEVIKFRDATLKGWKYAVDHPRETIDIILNQYHSEKSRSELQYEANETIKLIVPELVEIGHMNPGRWQHIAKTFSDLGLAQGKFLDDGFMFTPEKQQADLTLRIFVRVIIIIFFVSGCLITLLAYFNKKLKQAVTEKTVHLTVVNERLLASTKQLSEKE